MAIAPVSSVSFRNNYNQINFEGKKKEKSSGLHVSSSLKAIPLATMIALSPLNNVEASSYPVETTQTTQTFPDKVVLNGEVSGATRNSGERCFVSFISNDGNDSDAEKVTISFIQPMRGVKQVDGSKVPVDYKKTLRMFAHTLEVVNVTRKYADSPDEHFKEYYVIGSSDLTTSPKVASDGTQVEGQTVKKYSRFRYAITKEFYDILKEGMEDKIQYQITNKVVDGDAETDAIMDQLFDY